MHSVYILKSLIDNGLYIGVTNDLKRRIAEHNSGENKSTKVRRPLVLVYCESYRSRKDALIRERKLKQFRNSYTELKKRIRYSFLDS